MRVSKLEPRPEEGSGDTNCSTMQNQMSPDNVSGDANVSKTLNEKLHEEEPEQQKEEKPGLHTEEPRLQILKEKLGLQKEKPGLHKVAGAQQARRSAPPFVGFMVLGQVSGLCRLSYRLTNLSPN